MTLSCPQVSKQGEDDDGQSLRKDSEDWGHPSRVNSLERMLKATDLTQEAKIKGRKSLVVVNSILVPIRDKTRTKYLFHFCQCFASAVVLYRSRRLLCFWFAWLFALPSYKNDKRKNKHFEPVLHFMLLHIENVPVD